MAYPPPNVHTPDVYKRQGQKAQGQRAGEEQSDKLFHIAYLLFIASVLLCDPPRGTFRGGVHPNWVQKNALEPCQGRELSLRGTTLLHPFLTDHGPYRVRDGDSPPILLRCYGRPRRSLMPRALGARLRDHVRRSLPYPFPPIRALCDVSLRLLFSSLPLGKRYSVFLGCT